MKKRKLRIISKIGLLFVVIGFFLPMSCNLNGFQIARTFETFGGPNILSISLYSIFIFSCIGLILLAALLMKRKFSIGYDWADLIIIIAAFSVFMYGQIQSSDDPLLALFSRLQSGAYIIFIGLAGALWFLIAATNKTKNKVYEGEKVLDEDTRKKIEIRKKLFKKIPRRMDIIGTFIGCIIYCLGIIVLAKLLFKLPLEPMHFYILVILGILFTIIIFIIPYCLAIYLTPYLTGFIVFIIYDKKIFVYWRELCNSGYFDLYLFNQRKNKKVHFDLDLHSLWYSWNDNYRKGKGILR